MNSTLGFIAEVGLFTLGVWLLYGRIFNMYER